MQNTDYTKIENQIGCGWCGREYICNERRLWMCKTKNLPYHEKRKTQPILECGKFIYWTLPFRLSDSEISENQLYISNEKLD